MQRKSPSLEPQQRKVNVPSKIAPSMPLGKMANKTPNLQLLPSHKIGETSPRDDSLIGSSSKPNDSKLTGDARESQRPTPTSTNYEPYMKQAAVVKGQRSEYPKRDASREPLASGSQRVPPHTAKDFFSSRKQSK